MKYTSESSHAEEGKAVRRAFIFILAGLLCLIATLKAVGPETTSASTNENQIRRFEGLMDTGFTLPDGRLLPIFFDPSRKDFPPSDTSGAAADELLKALAAEGLELKSPIAAMEMVARSLALAGKEEEGAIIGISLRIIVYPKKGTPGKKLIGNPATFSAGPLKSLKEVIDKFGEPAEKEMWATVTTRKIALDGVVHWWGEIGAAASRNGLITHVLIRQAPKK